MRRFAVVDYNALKPVYLKVTEDEFETSCVKLLALASAKEIDVVICNVPVMDYDNLKHFTTMIDQYAYPHRLSLHDTTKTVLHRPVDEAYQICSYAASIKGQEAPLLYTTDNVHLANFLYRSLNLDKD